MKTVKNKNPLVPFFVFLMILSGKIMSQAPNNLPLYQEGKLYLQLKLNSNVIIQNPQTIINDPAGDFNALFVKYQVVKTELPFAVLNTSTLNKAYRISFNQVTKVDSFISDLSHIISHVDYAEKVPAVYTFSVPNDPLAVPPSTVLYHLPLLNANQASNIHISNGNAVVAIVDDAVLTTHEDLAANIFSLNADVTSTVHPTDPNPPLTGPNAVSSSHFTHGTHVAGIAGAVTNNNLGIASIGWNNKLMCVKIKDDDLISTGLQDPYGGLAWAAANGAHVINMSWGNYSPSLTEYNVVVTAKSHDVVLVAGAGNDGGNNPIYPAAYGEGTTGQSWEVFDRNLVVAVAAIDAGNNRSIWTTNSASNYGHWVDIATYGSNIMSTIATSTLGTAIINQYLQMSGTSMAAPIVSGIAGIMRSYNMSRTADQIIDCLIHTANPDIYGSAHPINQPGTLGSGRADAEAALRCLSSTCSVSPVAIIVPGSTSLCANTTLTLTANQGAATYSWSTGATTPSIVVTTPGVYSVVAGYGGTCSATASFNFPGPPTLSLSLTTNTSICPGFSVNLISASGNYSALVWQPGGMITNSVVVNPTVNTVYSVTANPLCGGTTATISVNATGSSQPPYSNYSVLGPGIAGDYKGLSSLLLPSAHFIINTNATVNTYATFYFSDVLFAPNANITVPSGSTLNIIMTHLQSCGTDMWQGIVVNDGAQLICDDQSFIEDAVTAISSTHTPLYSPGLPPAKIWVSYTLFNKNYIDISLTNYYDFLPGPLSYSNSLKVQGCVFTCRNFSIPWATAGGMSNLGIRAAISATTALAPPYLNPGFTPTTLKNPYSNQPSHIAIQLNTVGVVSTGTTGASDVVIGSAGATNFNLFDTHGQFIAANNSNVKLINNVFQNTQSYTVATGTLTSTFGGGAVVHRTNGVQNTELMMLAPNINEGNRFWNCHRGIEGKDIYRFWIENAIFRSNQSVATPSFAPTGIQINTNRCEYYIHKNEFNNLSKGINIPLAAGQYSIPAGYPPAPTPAYNPGIFADRLRIHNNLFIGNSGGTEYMSDAITVTGVNNVYWYGAVDNSTSPTTKAVAITSNTLSEVFRGVNVSGITAFPAFIDNNQVTLKDNSTLQYGIKLTNSTPAMFGFVGGYLYGKTTVAQNTSSFSSAPSNTNSAHIFLGNNGYTPFSPSVTCNETSQGGRGFQFEGPNAGAIWAGNEMNTLDQGFVLSTNGKIGQQGGTNLASANHWTLVNQETFAFNSIPQGSPLYIRTATGLVPSINLSSPVGQNYNQANCLIPVGVTAGDYNCTGIPNSRTASVPINKDDLVPVDEFYMELTDFYRYLIGNDSILINCASCADFYDTNIGTSIGQLYEVEVYLYQNDYTNARPILSSIGSGTNTIEVNYITFYTLYANYLENGALSQEEKGQLYDLAVLCPGINGRVVYQARALYNFLYHEILNQACDLEDLGKMGIKKAMQAPDAKSAWAIQLFPNPAANTVTFQSSSKNEALTVTIKDLSNRSLLKARLKTSDFISILDLELPNGAYLVDIENNSGQRTTKKLLIAK